jgi:hypothetical protein
MIYIKEAQRVLDVWINYHKRADDIDDNMYLLAIESLRIIELQHELLKELEWSETGCHRCGNYKRAGHMMGCKLDAALKEVGE